MKHNPLVRNAIKELKFIAHQLEQARQLYQLHFATLAKIESALNTELTQMEDRTPRYSPDKYPEREKFLRQLQGIEKERRQLALKHQEKEHSLQDRLSNLEAKLANLTGLDHAD